MHPNFVDSKKRFCCGWSVDNDFSCFTSVGLKWLRWKNLKRNSKKPNCLNRVNVLWKQERWTKAMYSDGFSNNNFRRESDIEMNPIYLLFSNPLYQTSFFLFFRVKIRSLYSVDIIELLYIKHSICNRL